MTPTPEATMSLDPAVALADANRLLDHAVKLLRLHVINHRFDPKCMHTAEGEPCYSCRTVAFLVDNFPEHTRECNQCGARAGSEWKSWQCCRYPFGSCDGEMVPSALREEGPSSGREGLEHDPDSVGRPLRSSGERR